MKKTDTIYLDMYDEYGRPVHYYRSEWNLPVFKILEWVDQADAWDAEIWECSNISDGVEIPYTARDGILSVAYWLDIDTSKFETYDELQDAIESALESEAE